MSARTTLVAIAACVMAGCAPLPAAVEAPSFRPEQLASACAGRDGWGDPAPPARIFGNVHYVGTCGITALLVTSPDGHVLIDSGIAEAAPQVLANIRRLGFDPRDVRWLLASHEHHDHVGGLAALKAATGAKVAALAPAVAVLESGRADPADPQNGLLEDVQPVRVDRVLADGEVLSVGPLRLTAHATPAHVAGSTSWTWQSCEGARCVAVAYADSVSTPAADGYRFTEHPERIASIRQALPKVAALPCDLLITPHPAASNLFARLAGEAPLIAPDACRTYAQNAEQAFAARLAKEASQ